MYDAEFSATAGSKTMDTVAAQLAFRRAERRDMVIASTLLVLLLAGWIARLVGVEQTWRIPTDYPVVAAIRHA